MHQKNNSLKLQEQMNTPAVDTDVSSIETNDAGTGALHAFPITSDTMNAMNQLINGSISEWKSETPLNIIGSDGTIGGISMLDGLPIYLMIRIANKSVRASKEVQLKLSDRVYVLLDTSKKELQNWLIKANSKDERVRASVKTPVGREHSIELWKESVDQPVSNESPDSSVTVDLEAQQQNPGTAAGVKGTVEENKKYDNMKKLDEQQAVEIRQQQKDKALLKPKTKEELMAMSAVDLKAELAKNKGNVQALNLIAQVAKERTAKQTALKNKKSKSSAPTSTAPASPFADQAAGDAFRAWANSSIELAKKYGKMSPYDLDEKGKFNNSFIIKAYAAAKTEYDAHLKSKEAAPAEAKVDPKIEAKYKDSQYVYYKEDEVVEEPNVDVEPETKEVKPRTKPGYAINKQYGTGANPRISEAIASSYSAFKSITEEDETEDKEVIDKRAQLLQDFKDGKIKKGIFKKEVDKDNIVVNNVETEKDETINVANIIDAKVAKAAEVKVEAEKKAEAEDTRTSSEKAKDTLDKEKGETEDLKGELKNKRQEKRDAKKNVRQRKKAERKTGRQEKKQGRIEKRIDKQEKKIKNIGESVVYNFEDFMKSVNKLN